MTTKQIYQTMFDNAVHIGHRTHKWNPRMKKFIYGEQNGIHIINLEYTAKYLEEALNFISKVVSEGKTILFVSTKPQTVNLVENTAKDCSMQYVVSKWIPGLLTNFSTLKTRIKYLIDLKDQKEKGEFDKYTKKEASKLDKTIATLEASLGGVQSLKGLPDAVFIVDAVRDSIVVNEARKLNIPVVALVDTNADPTIINYPIPANDDAIKSLNYLLDRVAEVIKGSRKSKK